MSNPSVHSITLVRGDREGRPYLSLKRSGADDPKNWGLVIEGGDPNDVLATVESLFAPGWEEAFRRFPQAYVRETDGASLAGGEIVRDHLQATVFRAYPPMSGYMPTHIADLAAQVVQELNSLKIVEIGPAIL